MEVFKIVFFISCVVDLSAVRLWNKAARHWKKSSCDLVLSNPNECLRDCTVHPETRICHFSFHLEYYTSNNKACSSCTPDSNTHILNDCQCILGDGVERMVKVVNRMLPGPSIQVCKYDKVVIDVTNHMDGEGTSIHWHGILQGGSQYYDGVPAVTQCLIEAGSSFRYQWIAEKAGTHWWHSHTGFQELDGVFGSLIVRDPYDPHVNRYDYDSANHVIIVSDWMHEGAKERFPGKLVNKTGQIPKTFLINGLGWNYKNSSTEKLSIFEVQPKMRHRFRFINACGSVCPSRLTIQGHKLLVIATDGSPIEPVFVDALTSFSGERFDFIVTATRRPGSYWIEIAGLGECAVTKVHQVAVLRYSGTKHFVTRVKPTVRNFPAQLVVLNPFDDVCPNNRTNSICIDELKSLQEYKDQSVIGKNVKVDHKIYLSFQFEILSETSLFKSQSRKTYLVSGHGIHVRSLINNITSVYPPSPYISQYNDNPPYQFCNFMDEYINHEEHRSCSHMIPVALNSVVELIIVDEVQVPNLAHPFHLHGTDFYVVGMDEYTNRKKKMSRYEAMSCDKDGTMKRNFNNVPIKDTLVVPRNGYIVVRFRATNPGFWLLHCHYQYHVAVGMHLVLKVGEQKDLPPIPRNFPRCGNFKPMVMPLK